MSLHETLADYRYCITGPLRMAQGMPSDDASITSSEVGRTVEPSATTSNATSRSAQGAECVDHARLVDLECKVDAKLIQQEHRLFWILLNYWEYRTSENAAFRVAARHALVYRVVAAMVPTAAVSGVGITAILSVYLAWHANALLREQNEEIRRQSSLAFRPQFDPRSPDPARYSFEVGSRTWFGLHGNNPARDQPVKLYNSGVGAALSVSYAWHFELHDFIREVQKLDDTNEFAIRVRNGDKQLEIDMQGSTVLFEGNVGARALAPVRPSEELSLRLPESYLELLYIYLHLCEASGDPKEVSSIWRAVPMLELAIEYESLGREQHKQRFTVSVRPVQRSDPDEGGEVMWLFDATVEHSELQTEPDRRP
jgi:hypothetical protein